LATTAAVVVASLWSSWSSNSEIPDPGNVITMGRKHSLIMQKANMHRYVSLSKHE